MKQKKTVVVGVSSGIAAYKTIELVQLLKKDKFDVHVIMTQSAAKMVSPAEFEKVLGGLDSGQARMTKKRVYTQLFEEDFDYKNILKIRKVEHIDLADKADVFVIAPATANIIAKIAYGMADDFLTTSILATQAPILICPSMNVHMWENPVVQNNVHLLKQRGMYILEPEEGDLACGYRGKGRLAHIYHIRDEITSILQKKEPIRHPSTPLRINAQGKQLKGKKILVTAGGTMEPIDDVRSITNKSSGKMGVALADACAAMGADVVLLRSENSVRPRQHMQELEFVTADDLEKLLQKEVKNTDIVFHVAAVSDFQLKEKLRGKTPSDKKLTLTLSPREKILHKIKTFDLKAKLIGFKAVWGGSKKTLIKVGQEKLQESGADAIVVNDISKSDRGFGADTNEVFIVTKNAAKKIPLQSKQKVAEEIIDYILA